MRRHESLSEEEQLSWLYRNLLPEYRLNIRRSDIIGHTSFFKAVREAEALRKEMELNQRRQRHVTMVESRGLKHYSPPTPKTSFKDNPTGTERRSATTATSSRAVTTRENPKVPKPLETICWRCGEAGHYRTQCRNPPKLFCSRRRREGILSKDCPCPGNFSGTTQ